MTCRFHLWTIHQQISSDNCSVSMWCSWMWLVLLLAMFISSKYISRRLVTAVLLKGDGFLYERWARWYSELYTMRERMPSGDWSLYMSYGHMIEVWRTIFSWSRKVNANLIVILVYDVVCLIRSVSVARFFFSVTREYRVSRSYSWIWCFLFACLLSNTNTLECCLTMQILMKTYNNSIFSCA